MRKGAGSMHVGYLLVEFVLQCVAVCCSILQCVAVCCSVSHLLDEFALHLKHMLLLLLLLCKFRVIQGVAGSSCCLRSTCSGISMSICRLFCGCRCRFQLIILQLKGGVGGFETSTLAMKCVTLLFDFAQRLCFEIEGRVLLL